MSKISERAGSVERSNCADYIPPMTHEMIEKVRKVEHLSRQRKQVKIPVQHYLHGGVYVRTVKLPAGVMITGAHIIIETNLVVSGHAMVHDGDEWLEIQDYKVLAAAAHRKQIFIAISDVDLTMFFPTTAKNVREAEEQFTSEANLLQNWDE